ncbi:EF-hand domain-containing protein [Gallaecimonas mangrovi]|uniref:EF-hand domain-containing protein n=1 Tax=Gallaecimonas mangrovi TaxID=2291597 RepID=UPI0018660C5E|nr:EF-hand domain-containing protein [Gallaecimonas mangrovi]
MYKKTLLALAVLLGASTWAQADDNNRGGPMGGPPSFDSLDTNSDGVISKDEASKDPMLSQMFSRIDSNGDGEISESEFNAAMQHGPGGGMGGGMKGGRGGPPSFESLDSNGDGVISKDEAASDPMLSKMFDKLDTNGDGVLSKDEMKMPPPPERN